MLEYFRRVLMYMWVFGVVWLLFYLYSTTLVVHVGLERYLLRGIRIHRLQQDLIDSLRIEGWRPRDA